MANKLVSKVRKLFKLEWTWRMFLILQAVGLIGIIYGTVKLT